MSKGTLLGLAAAVVVLLAATFYWSGDSSSDLPGDDDVRATRRHASDDRGNRSTAGGRQRAGTRERAADAGNDADPGNDRQQSNDRGSARRRVPGGFNRADAPGAAQRGSGSSRRDNLHADNVGRDSFGSVPGGGGGGGSVSRPRSRRGEDTGHDRPNLPEGHDAQPEPVDGAVTDPGTDAPAEPIKEVAYEQDPDRLFDTGVPMEVQGAGRVSPDGGMVSFWIQPEWANNKEDSADLMRLGESGLALVKEGSFLRFQFTDAGGNEQGGDADIGHWNDGEWHHVIATWTGNGMSLFVDGGQAFQNVGITRPPAGSDPRMFVGSDYPDGTGIALAAMANVTVVNKSPSVEEVQKLFQSTGPVRK